MIGPFVTVRSLVKDLQDLGMKPGMTVLVHSSLSSLGWVCGGAPAVIQALEEVLTEEGTLVMPTHSGDLSDPAHWQNPPVPEDWWPTIRDEMPAFSPDLTPTREMGVVPETFRKQNGVRRSGHPSASFAAWGRLKDVITGDSPLDFAQNEASPLGKVYEADGQVLLLGVGHDKNTSLHLAEYRAAYAKTLVSDGVPLLEHGARVWKTVKDILYNADDFPAIGADFEALGKVSDGTVGKARARLFSQRELVDHAVRWMEGHRV